jgi:putative alpha-1,2-mannosidase
MSSSGESVLAHRTPSQASDRPAPSAPFFDEVTVSLPHIPGHRLVISAPGSSSGRKYVRSFRINGEALHEPSITHRQLEQGGHWEIELADSPQEWGSRRAEGARI